MIWRLKNALGKEEIWYRKAVIEAIKEQCEDCIKYATHGMAETALARHLLDFLKDIENGIFKKEK